MQESGAVTRVREIREKVRREISVMVATTVGAERREQGHCFVLHER